MTLSYLLLLLPLLPHPPRLPTPRGRSMSQAKKTVHETIVNQAAQRAIEAVATTSPETEAIIADLVRDFTSPSEIIEVIMPSGVVLTFHSLTDRKAKNDLRKRALAFAQETITHPDPEINAAYNTDIETKVQAFMLAELSVKPKWRIVDLLRLAHRATLSFDVLFEKWANAHGQRELEREVYGIEEAVKRIEADAIWRMRLRTARDVYGEHPLQLEGGTYEDFMLIDFVALYVVEGRERDNPPGSGAC